MGLFIRVPVGFEFGSKQKPEPNLSRERQGDMVDTLGIVVYNDPGSYVRRAVAL